MRIPYGEFRPDETALDTADVSVARNVYAKKLGYGPMPIASAQGDTMEADAVPCGAGLFQKSAGDFLILAGSTTKLWLRSGSSWTAIATGLNATVDERWSSAQFGTTALFCNINDELLGFDVDVGGSAAAVPDSPPRARFVGVIDRFAVLAGLNDDPRAIAWSDIGNHEVWQSGLADTQDFKSGGRVMNFSGSAGLVILERSAWQMFRTPGSDTGPFGFQEVIAAKGAISPWSVIKFGPRIAHLSEDGFYVSDSAGTSTPIGAGKIDRYFLSQVNQERLYSVIGTMDPIRKHFIWIFKDGATDYYNRGLVYNWTSGRWSEFDDTAFPGIGGLWDLVDLATAGVSLEELGALYPDLDVDVPLTLDSRVWQGGRPVLAGLGAEGKLVFFEGASAPARITTGEVQFHTGYRSQLNAVWPEVDTTAATMTALIRENLAQSSPGIRGPGTMQPSGRIPLRAGGRLHRLQMDIPGGTEWAVATGIREIDAKRLGTR